MSESNTDKAREWYINSEYSEDYLEDSLVPDMLQAYAEHYYKEKMEKKIEAAKRKRIGMLIDEKTKLEAYMEENRLQPRAISRKE